MDNLKSKSNFMDVLTERGWGTDLKFEYEEIVWDKLTKYAKQFVEDMKTRDKAMVLYDVDVDGLFSGFFIEHYLERLDIEVFRYMNKNKAHGLAEFDSILNKLKDNNIEVLVVPDAGTNDIEQLKTLEDNGIKVYVLDHHEIEGELMDTEYVKVLNINEDRSYPKLSGAGVTYLFIDEVNKYYKLHIGMYENLVGVTVLSDVCDMTDNTNRYFVKKLYDNYESFEFFKVFDFYGSFKSLMTFKVIPFLNALIRTGENDLAMRIVNDLNNASMIRGVVKPLMYTNKQEQNKMVENLKLEGKLFKLDGCTVHIRKGHKYKNVGGLLANKYLDKYNQSCLVLGVDPETKQVSGSFRGLNFDYTLLRRFGFECKGHDLACGVSGSQEIFTNFLKEFGVLEEEKLGTTLRYVDAETSIRNLKDKRVMKRLALFNEYTGKGVNPIKIKITNPELYDITVNRFNNFSEVIIDNMRIVDFKGIEEEDIVVEPVYDETRGFQLIRVSG